MACDKFVLAVAIILANCSILFVEPYQSNGQFPVFHLWFSVPGGRCLRGHNDYFTH